MAVRLGIPESVAGVPLARRLAWVVIARVGLLFVALGAFAALNVSRGFQVGSSSQQIVLAMLATAFALAGVYGAVLRLGRGLESLAVAQLVLDQATVTVLVYVTGGTASGATSFYGLTCLLGAFLIGFRGALVAGVAGVVCYVSLADALHMAVVRPPVDQAARIYAVTSQELFYYVVVNVLVIGVVTVLSGYLAERLRTAGGRIVEAEARAENAERMAVLGRLAAGLAHEIRNPLGSIAGSVQLLRTNPALSADDRKLCDIIQRETARLNDLVGDMMDVSKPRKPEISTINVARIAREVVELSSKQGRGVSDVAVAYEGENAIAIRADGAQIRQLIWNLIRNGVQASKAGGKVEVRIEVAPDGSVVLTVSDDGVGIDPEARARLFDAFFTTRSHGTGIGLAVVKRIADDHGFRIEVDNTLGSGAVFRVSLGSRVPPEPDMTSFFPPAADSGPARNQRMG
jgi:signal transduction histidine kinase